MRQSSVKSLVFTAGLAAILFPVWSSVSAQQQPAPAAPAPMIHQPDNPALRGFKWRPIGPVGQGVRIDDIAVDEKNPTTFYIGYAVAGIAKTVNNGTTFTQIFDTYGSASIADIAIAPSNSDILYVATGEANNRQTTSYGDGLYKSTDAGQTFTNLGFKDSQSLGRVLVHPRDPNIVWMAVGGHLYGPNTERGVFMTIDGGKTWTKTLYVDEYTSATEIAIDPSNPMNLWAAMYQRQRTAWGFNGGGPGSGLYNSIDGGKKWTKINAPGLPKGTLGRVAMDFCKAQPNVLYAQIEAGLDKAPPAVPGPPAPAAAAGAAGQAGAGTGAPGGQGRGGRGNNQVPNPQYSGVFKSIDKGKTWTFQSNENQRPMYFSQIRVDPNNCETVYLGGVGPTKSTDSGKTWNGLNNMGHVDNHAIWIDPLNSKHVMYGNDGGLDVSYDAGATWESLRNTTGGLAYHASADMRRPYRVCTGLQDNGSWCGPSSVRNGDGIRQWMWQSVGGGDGFQSQIDRDNPNIFYTESQNAGISRYNYDTGEVRSIRPSAGLGGRGGGGVGGGIGRGNILNPIPNGVVAFNWNSPIRLSPFSTSTMYLGGRSLYISRDRGDTWTTTKELGKGINLDDRSIMGVKYSTLGCGYAPPEGAPTPAAGGGGGGGGGGGRGGSAGPGVPCILSKNDGYVANEFGTMTEMAESPILPGILWAGTDDGNIQVSRDGGNNWEEVGKNIPGVDHEYYVSGLEASWFEAGTAYAALDGHRHNDLKPYVFKTTDYGKTWTNITGDLPAPGNVNSIRQDPANKNLLFAPTELGFYVSLNDGKNWHRFMPNLPIGRTDEVLVHPREKDLILATHSRSVWIMDDISALENMTEEQLAKDATVLPVRDAIVWKNDRRIGTTIPGDKWWQGENAPRGTAISFNVKTGGEAKVTITDTVTGSEFRTESTTAVAGLNRWQWNLCSTPVVTTQPQGRGGGGGGQFGGGCQGGGRAATPGIYKLSVSVGGKEIGTQMIRVLEDIWMNEK